MICLLKRWYVLMSVSHHLIGLLFYLPSYVICDAYECWVSVADRES